MANPVGRPRKPRPEPETDELHDGYRYNGEDPEPAADRVRPIPMGTVLERHNRVVSTQEFTDYVPTDPRPITETDPEKEAEDAKDDPILEFLESFKGTEGEYTVRVERLANYNEVRGKTGTTTKGLKQEFCGEIVLSYTFLSEIQENWGAGVYRLTVLNPIKRLVSRWTQHIAAPLGGGGSPPPMMLTKHYGGGQVPAPIINNQLQGLAEVAKQIKEIQTLFANDQPSVIQAAPAESAEKSIEDRKWDLLLTLVGKNENAVDKIIGLIAPESNGGGTGVWDVVAEGVKQLIPMVAPLLQQGLMIYLTRQQRAGGTGATAATVTPPAQQPQPARAAIPPGGPRQYATWIQDQSTPTPKQQPGPEPEDDEGEEDPIMELLDALTSLLMEAYQRQVIDPALIERGAGWIEAFRIEMPGAAGIVDNLLSGTPEQLLAALVMVFPNTIVLQNSPIAIECVRALQRRVGNDSSLHQDYQQPGTPPGFDQPTRRERRRGGQRQA